MPYSKLIDNPRVGEYNALRIQRMKHVVNQERCTGCGSCQEICPTEAISIRHGKAEIMIECVDCGACPRVCPEGAIRRQEVNVPAATIS